MRKMQKDSVIELVNLLKKAQEHVKNLLDQQAYASVLDLLQQCQEVAIQIGTTIEQTEGEGFPTVKKLEEYCELIFQVFEMVQGCTEQTVVVEGVCKPDADVICGAMDRLLFEIEESIQKDIEVRKEVVFLPYKASMWDSLESVWMAADADPDCDAYVVPIPYFDKNPDGSAKEMHYEGDLYPDYVPITHYDDYNIEQRHPDMIFIHNPYDEANYVTSVHPMFYAKRLKELTDCLVYIPYFVLAEIDPKNRMRVKNMEHFVMLPGVIHAHKVIVQSQDMRQIYIDVMSEVAGEETRYYWEEKILGIGSPKFDKIHGTTKEHVKVPEEWLKIIEKPDGQWKKIIFYNTSVTALLEHSEEMLDKMKDVFAVFRENKDEVALLWRPHPLIKATIESMRPRLWEEYRKLVEQYKEEGWGIYDDTPDMDRAIAICDGYYGDGSSVVHLVREAGKPVMLQRCNVRNNFRKNYIPILTEDSVKVDNKIYFFAKDINLFIALDVYTGHIEKLGGLPEEDVLAQRLCGKIVHWNGQLIFVPINAEKIWMYNLETNEWKGMERKISEKEQGRALFQAVLNGDKLFMVGSDYPRIICFDLSTEQVVYIEKPYERLIDVAHEIGDGYFRCDYARKGSRIYLASCLDNYVLEFDVNTLKYKWIKVGKDDNRYAGIAWDGNDFWLAPRTGREIVRWDGENNTEEYSIPNAIPSKIANFSGVVYHDGKIVFPGLMNPYTLIIDDLKAVRMTMVEGQYLFYKVDEDGIVLSQLNDGTMSVCSALNEEQLYVCDISRDELKKYVMENDGDLSELFMNGMICENSVARLEEYCFYTRNLSCKNVIMESENVGWKTWKGLMNE